MHDLRMYPEVKFDPVFSSLAIRFQLTHFRYTKVTSLFTLELAIAHP